MCFNVISVAVMALGRPSLCTPQDKTPESSHVNTTAVQATGQVVSAVQEDWMAARMDPLVN